MIPRLNAFLSPFKISSNKTSGALFKSLFFLEALKRSAFLLFRSNEFSSLDFEQKYQLLADICGMKIILISDTHGYLDPKLNKYFDKCDEIWHAGDIGSVEVVESLEKIKPCRIVYGNIDDHIIRSMTSLNLEWEIQGLKFAMTHIAGKPGKYYREGGQFFKNSNADVFICGHSHTLLVQHDQNLKGLWLNPGACGIKGFHKIRTLLRFEIKGGKLVNMEAIELGPRSTKANF